MRVLVYGSRDWTDRGAIHRDLDALAAQLEPGDRLVVINGFAPGADRMADEWASAHDRAVPYRFPADWPNCVLSCPPGHRRVNRLGVEYCPTAGHRRNQQMLDQGRPERALGYDRGTAGTADMTRRVIKAHVSLTLRDGAVGALRGDQT